MNLLRPRKPRRFSHINIYDNKHTGCGDSGTDEPRDRNFDEIKGAFVRGTKYVRRHKEKRHANRNQYLLRIFFLLLILLLIWHYLLTNTLLF